MGQAITESACRQWGARRFRKLLRVKGLGGRGKVRTGGSESATQGNRQKRVCRGRDSMGRKEDEAAIQGISGKRVCRGWNSMGMRENEAATQGNRQKKVCRGWDESFFIKMEQISR